jgi:hypothetical protein
MGKQEVDCTGARTWINDQLAAHPATRGLSVAPFTEYDPLGDPTDRLMVGPGARPDNEALNVVLYLWKQLGERFEIKPDPAP